MKAATHTAAVIGVGKAGCGGPKGGGHAIGYVHATMFKSAAPRVRLVAGGGHQSGESRGVSGKVRRAAGV